MAKRPTSCDIEIRVRYAETDRMGYLHHAQYIVYFEQGRTELLRRGGIAYKILEEQGYFLVVVKLEIHYRQPARYDDLLRLHTELLRTTPVRIEHQYQLYCEDRLLTVATSTLACVDKEGKLQPLPELLRID